MKKIKCIIIDDEIEACNRLKHLLEKNDFIDILSINQDPDIGIEEIYKYEPDIAFVDIEMPNKSGCDIIKDVYKHDSNTKIIFVTDSNQYAIRALRKSVFDYLLKPVDIDDITEALNRYIDLQKKKHEFKIPKQIIEKYNLSKREMEIIKQIANYKTSQEIANTLFISKNTVDTHRRNILKKTGMQRMGMVIIKLLLD